MSQVYTTSNHIPWYGHRLITGPFLVKLPSKIVQLFLNESRFRVTEENVFQFLKLYKEKHSEDDQNDYDINDLIPCMRFKNFSNEYVVGSVK